MATNSTTNSTMAKNPARKLIAYDLVIGILAIFSLLLLIPIFFGNLSSQDRMVFIYLEEVLGVVFLFDFFRNLAQPQTSGHISFKGGGWLDLLGGIPYYAFAIFRVARLFRIVRQLRRMTGGELRRMLTRQLAQSTLLFTLVVALILVFTISWGVLLAEQSAPNANIKTYHEAVWWGFRYHYHSRLW